MAATRWPAELATRRATRAPASSCRAARRRRRWTLPRRIRSTRRRRIRHRRRQRIRHRVRRLGLTYLADQTYLAPYPEGLRPAEAA